MFETSVAFSHFLNYALEVRPGHLSVGQSLHGVDGVLVRALIVGGHAEVRLVSSHFPHVGRPALTSSSVR
jgi:hypothetical protein